MRTRYGGTACACEKCIEQARASDRARYAAAPDKKKARSNAYFIANRAAVLEQNKAYRFKNAENLRQQDRDWYEKNKLADNLRRSEYYRANKPATRLRIQKWYEANKATIIAKSLVAQTKRADRTVSWQAELSELVFLECIDLADRRSQATQIVWEVDHMVPLLAHGVSGLHVWNNLQVIPRSINRAKKNKLLLTEPGQWLCHL